MANATVITSDVGITIFHNSESRENVMVLFLGTLGHRCPVDSLSHIYSCAGPEDSRFPTPGSAEVARAHPQFRLCGSRRLEFVPSHVREKRGCGTNPAARSRFGSCRLYRRPKSRATSTQE